MSVQGVKTQQGLLASLLEAYDSMSVQGVKTVSHKSSASAACQLARDLCIL